MAYVGTLPHFGMHRYRYVLAGENTDSAGYVVMNGRWSCQYELNLTPSSVLYNLPSSGALVVSESVYQSFLVLSLYSITCSVKASSPEECMPSSERAAKTV